MYHTTPQKSILMDILLYTIMKVAVVVSNSSL